MHVLWRVYIDEAGDRGISDAASAHFVASAIIVRGAEHQATRRELADLRRALGRQPGQVLHFQKFSHSQRLKAAQDLAGFSIDAIVNVILCKRGFNQPSPAGDVAYITNPDPMYLWATRLLLERVSWRIRDGGGGTAVVTFAHVRRFKTQKLHDYRAALASSPTKIHWPSFDGHAFKVDAPHKIELLQLADTAASALYRAVEPDEFGNTERRYLQELRPKLYRRGGASITSYGLKVFPSSECDTGGSLSWLRDM
jgi:hypothetical protein